MKNTNVKYIITVLACLALSSCNKELNVLPTTSVVDGNVISDTKTAATALNGVYYRFSNAQASAGVQTMEWSAVNEIFPSELCGSILDAAGDDLIYTLKYNLQTYGEDRIWVYAYQIVNAANGFLKNVAPVTNIPAATKNQMIAEAKFLRAYANSELLLYYAQYYDPTSKYGIVIRNDFVSGDNIDLPRSSVADSYTAILADLDAAIPSLPKSNTAIYYANSAAAKLLEARVLINRGAQADYAKVISLTQDIIANSGFTLEPNIKDLFLTKGFSSPEVILGAQPYPTQIYKYYINNHFGEYPITNSLASLFANDPRNQWVFKADHSGTLYGKYYGPINELTKFYSGPTIGAVQTPASELCYAFRLTEAYLLQAEAITLSNGDLSLAKTLLKTIESHAGITNFTDVDNTATAAQLQLLIVKEELKSFVSEAGQDWFALRRLPFAAAQTFQPALKSTGQLILPIPYSETSANNQVIQNP